MLKRHRGKTVLGLVLTVVLLWWALRDVSPTEVWLEVRQADVGWMALAVLLATFSFVLRAWRWRWLLLPVKRTGFESRFGSVCLGFAMNNVLPARLGEFGRSYALARVERIPLAASIASLVLERVLDGVVLAIILFGTISLPAFPLGEGTTADVVRRTANVGALLFASGLVVLWMAARRPEGAAVRIGRLLHRVLPARFAQKGEGLALAFLKGLGALRDLRVFLVSLTWSFVVWACLVLSIDAGLRAFGIAAPGVVGAAFLQALIAFAVAAPSSPGFFGVFEAACRLGLGVWDIAPSRVVSFATSYHILTFIPVTLIGLWYLRRFGLSWEDVERGEARAEETIEALESGARPGGEAAG